MQPAHFPELLLRPPDGAKALGADLHAIETRWTTAGLTECRAYTERGGAIGDRREGAG